MANFGGKIGRIKGRITQKKNAITRMKDKIYNAYAYGSTPEKAQRKYGSQLDRLNSELNVLKQQLTRVQGGARELEQRRKAEQRAFEERRKLEGERGTAEAREMWKGARKGAKPIGPARPLARPPPTRPKWYQMPSFRKGARGVKKYATTYSGKREKKEFWAPWRGLKWLRRRGMTGEQWKQYKTEQRRVMAERGEYLTPTQKWFVKIGFLIVVVIIVIAIFSYTNVGKAIMSKVEVVPVLNKLWVGVLQAWERLVQKITGVGVWRNPYATETKEKKGVEITDIVSIKDTFLPEDKIEIIGEGFVHALDKETEVCFRCSMDKIGGSIDEDKRCLHVLPNEERSFAIRCNLGKREFEVKDLIYKKVKFVALYKDFVTNARLRLYTLPKHQQEKLGTIDPFKKYEIRDSLLDSKMRTTRSSYEYGPVKISMYVVDRQPLSKDKYMLKIGADIDKTSWSGELGEGTLFLELPDVVKSECKRELPLEDGMTKYCDFEIINVEEGLSFIEVEAKAIYNFEFSDEKSITIAAKE